MDLWEYEHSLTEGIWPYCGVDEAGRGPLAGPVYAAAVILPPEKRIEGLNDSKKLSEKKREALFDDICSVALAYGIGSASVEEIEQINILEASFLAMGRAIEKLSVRPVLALVDGNRSRGLGLEARAVVKGDAKCASIAAASILAKVSRDRLMRDLALLYPEYGFERHKGYGTRAHFEALRQYGPCELHRPSFLRKL